MRVNDSSPERSGHGTLYPPSMTRSFSFISLMFLVAIVFSVSPIHADASRTGYGKNVQLVEQLLTKSVAARQIDEGDNVEAKAAKAKALELLKQARQAEEKGQLDLRDTYLQQAKEQMFSAMRQVGGKVVEDKKQRDFDQRYRNVEALLDAYVRISQEKQLPKSEQMVAQIKQAMATGRTELKKSNMVAALDHINGAYASLKIALIQLRSGDTLVNSLSFASKEEEYHYELDRNDTHKMLVNVLLSEKLNRSGMSSMVTMVMAKVDELREQADKAAKQGDFQGAIEKMEEATAQVVRLIRAAGIYIPG